MIGALLWIPAFAGMTGEACAGGNPLGVTVSYTDYSTLAS